MAQLMLVNPRHRSRVGKSRRKSGSTARRKRRAPARAVLSNPRRRRKRRMSAAQRAYFGKRRAVHSNPRRRRRRRRSVALLSNPVRRHRRRRMRSNPIRRYRRNPSMGKFNIKSFFKSTLVPSAIGAVGAVGIDALWGMAPIPANIKASPYAPAFKILATAVVGALGGRFIGKGNAEVIVGTAISIQIYNLVKPRIAAMLPAVTLGDVGWTQGGQFISGGMGQYVSGGMHGDAGALSWDQSPYGEEVL